MTKTSKFSRLFKFTWLSNHPICKEWDKTLNKILELPITHIDQYRATFGRKYEIWIENHPYCSGKLIDIKGDKINPAITNVLPYMSTRVKLEDIVNEHIRKNTISLYSDLLMEIEIIKTEV